MPVCRRLHLKWVSAATILTALLAHGAPVAAQAIPDHPMMSDRYFLAVGALWARSNVQASLNTGRVGVGTFIDFEKDLGLEDAQAIGLFMFSMRLSERWRLEAEYFRISRDDEKVVSRTIGWGNVDIPIGVAVDTSFTLEDARIGFGYSFFRTRDKEVGFGLGVHQTSIEAKLSTQSTGSQDASTSGPLPTFTIYSRMALTDRWMFMARIDRLSLDQDDFDGRISSSGIEFVFQPSRHFNIGMGFRDISYELSSTSDDWRGSMQIQQSGPLLYVGTTF